jgi:hypothetical protein
MGCFRYISVKKKKKKKKKKKTKKKNNKKRRRKRRRNSSSSKMKVRPNYLWHDNDTGKPTYSEIKMSQLSLCPLQISHGQA